MPKANPKPGASVVLRSLHWWLLAALFGAVFAVLLVAETFPWAAGAVVLGWAAHRAIIAANANPGYRLLFTTAIVLLAFCLYLLRMHRRVSYARLEIGFAVTAVWFAVGSRSLTPESTAAVLLGAIFVLVRGLDNYEQGKRAAGSALLDEEDDPLASIHQNVAAAAAEQARTSAERPTASTPA